MGKFTSSTGKMKTDFSSINTALKAKSVTAATKFSNIPDRIRAIEAGFVEPEPPENTFVYNVAFSDTILTGVVSYPIIFNLTYYSNLLQTTTKVFEFSEKGINPSYSEKPFIYDGANSSEGNIVYHTADNTAKIVITEMTEMNMYGNITLTQGGLHEFIIKIKDQYYQSSYGDQSTSVRVTIN